jgi:hypothetical protein
VTVLNQPPAHITNLWLWPPKTQTRTY